ELGLSPRFVDGHDRGADGGIGVVRERAARPRTGLDRHVVTTLDELECARRRERHAVLVLLDLLGDADLHAGSGDHIRLPRARGRGGFATKSARARHRDVTISPLALMLGVPPGTGPDQTWRR